MCNPAEEPKETKVEAISEKYQRMKRKKLEPEKVETRQETKDRQLVDKLLDNYKGNSAIGRFCENYISTGTKAT